MAKSKRDPKEVAAYLRQMACQQRDLAIEFDQQAARFDKDPDDHEADHGHTWWITVQCRGSAKVVGDEHHTDAPDFDPVLRSVKVRGWSLRSGLAEAAALPLSEWFDIESDEDEDD